MFHLRTEFGIWILVGVWLCAIAAAFAAWESYDSTPGGTVNSGETPSSQAATGQWALTVFVHPHCPCSRASLAELRELLAQSPVRLEARVLLVLPPGASDGWECGELSAAAAEISGLHVECDRNGVEARKAGATTSGYVVLYDKYGKVVFRGGITKARGRVGDNLGKHAVLAALQGDSGSHLELPTFGCPLFGSSACCNEG